MGRPVCWGARIQGGSSSGEARENISSRQEGRSFPGYAADWQEAHARSGEGAGAARGA